MPLVWRSDSALYQLVCDEHQVRALHAACVRIARERDEAGRLYREALQRFNEMRANRDLLGSERDEARRELEAVKAELAELSCVLPACCGTLKDAAETLLANRRDAERELVAERARADKAEAELAALRKRLAYRQDEDGSQSDEIDRLEMALRLRDNELAALKGQEPVAKFRVTDGIPEEPRGTANPDRFAGWANGEYLLYAAPVPPPDSVPREQHEAEVAQARRDERERVAAVLNNRGWHDAAEVVLALPDAGGEVGK